MNYFIHGDYHLKSRQFLTGLISSAKNKGKEIFRVDGIKADLNEIIQATSSNSLFGAEKMVVIENLFSRPKSKILEEILQFLKNYDGDNEILFWEKKSIGKILQRNLPKNIVVKEFKTPAIIFQFVESLSPNTKNMAIKNLAKILETQAPEFVMAMIVRQIRLLILIKGGEEAKGAPWVVGKLKKQAESFKNIDSLLQSYKKLYIIDKQNKTGQAFISLSFALENWITEL